MKYKTGNYIQLSRNIFDEKYKPLSDSAKWFYCYLSELEHRHTGEGKDWFYQTDAQLSDALGWSISKIQRAKRELKEAGLIQIMKTKNETSTRHFTAYRILK